MAAKKKAKKKAKKAPTLKVHDLKLAAKSPAKLRSLLKRAQEAKIGFVILNAPFRLRAA